MNRTPVLPSKKDQSWSDASTAYRQSLHENLYPKDTPWNPVITGVSSTAVTASFVQMGRFWSFAISIEGVTTSTAGTITLPFEVAQMSVFNVAVGGLNMPATIEKGQTTLILPNWTSAARALISGVAVN